MSINESKKLWLADDVDNVIWTSGDSDLVAVSEDGIITAQNHGLCIVQGEYEGKAYYIYVRIA